MDILEDLRTIVVPSQFRVLLYLVLANIGTGIIGALIQHNLSLSRLADHWKRVGTILGAYLVVGVATRGVGDFAPLMTVTWIALIGVLVAHILKNLKEWGLPVPDKIAGISLTPPKPPEDIPSP